MEFHIQPEQHPQNSSNPNYNADCHTVYSSNAANVVHELISITRMYTNSA